jgi:hypothetical protein
MLLSNLIYYTYLIGVFQVIKMMEVMTTTCIRAWPLEIHVLNW